MPTFKTWESPTNNLMTHTKTLKKKNNQYSRIQMERGSAHRVEINDIEMKK